MKHDKLHLQGQVKTASIQSKSSEKSESYNMKRNTHQRITVHKLIEPRKWLTSSSLEISFLPVYSTSSLKILEREEWPVILQPKGQERLKMHGRQDSTIYKCLLKGNLYMQSVVRGTDKQGSLTKENHLHSLLNPVYIEPFYISALKGLPRKFGIETRKDNLTPWIRRTK